MRKRSSWDSGNGKVPTLWVGQLPGHPVLAHLPLLHGLQKRALRFRRRAIDLIGEHQLRENGARMEVEAAGAGVVDGDPENVGRQQIAGELDALKAKSQHASQHMGQGRFADPGDILYEQMATRDEAGQREANLLLFAQHDVAGLGNDTVQFRAQS
jgi:hypothetical protein